MKGNFKWGIIGLGKIANKFATAMIDTPGAEIAAVADVTQELADAFADKYSIPKRYDNCKALAADPELDAVYIAVPNPFHYENIMLCLQNNKPVLCEKPFTLNAKEAKIAINYAREHKIFLMEAVWTRFLPVYEKVREWIKSGLIGDIRMLKADIGFFVPWPEGDRHINPALGGGSLLDVGTYNVALASWVFGRKPERIVSMAQLGKTGIDEQATLILDYGAPQMAVLTSSLIVDTLHDATIFGSKGSIHLKDFWRATTAVLSVKGAPFTETFYRPFTNGFEYEIMAVMKCIEDGMTECPLNTLDESLIYSEILDEARTQWGLEYPSEVK